VGKEGKFFSVEEKFIVAFARTPFGLLAGALRRYSAPQLGATAIRAAVERAGVEPISEVILGHVLSAGSGQAPARQAALGAGLDPSTSCMAINKVCGSGMKAVMLAARSPYDLVVAGGMESMSQAPHLLRGVREGHRLGNQLLIDSLLFDGLWDVYSERHMGSCVEECVQEHEISRAEQDAYAAASYRRALGAEFSREIVAVGDVARDEGPSKFDFERMAALSPVFEKEGTITAANASTINDGAAALVVASKAAVERFALKPLARIVSMADHAHEPTWFSTAPAGAMRRAMEEVGWELESVDLFEVNEAFAAVPLLVQRRLSIPEEKLNIKGGAVSLGHPIGASGARLVGSLALTLQERGLRRGVASICIGGGEATAICIENVG